MSDQTPQWRKVLLSGSNAHVNEITGSGVISAPTIGGNSRRVLVIDTQSGAFYYSGSFGTGGGGSGTPSSPLNSIQYNDGGDFGGDAGFIFDDTQGASLFIDGPITGSNISSSGIISASAVYISGSSGNSLTVSSGTGDVAINAISNDANCIIRVQDNSTTSTNVLGLVAKAEDLVMRIDEGNFKVQTQNQSLDALIINQSGSASFSSNISATGSILGTSATSQIIIGEQSVLNSTVKAQISHHDDATAPVIMDFIKSRGTLASPTAVAQNDFTGTQRYLGYDGSNYRLTSAIRGDIDTRVSVTTNQVPGALNFLTTQNGSLNSRMFIDSSGNVGIGSFASDNLPGELLTVAGNISASKALFISTSLSTNDDFQTILIDTGSGKLFFTGSYGGGGGGGISFNGSTTDGVVTFGNTSTADVETNLRFNNSDGLRVYQNAQFNYGQNGSFGGNVAATTYKAGQLLETSQLRTYVTPQSTTRRFAILGAEMNSSRKLTTNNFLIYSSSLFFDPSTGKTGGHDGTGKDGTLGTIGRIQVSDADERTGITISGNPEILFFNNDASSSSSGSFNFDSASAQIKFDTGSSGVQFLTGETTEALTQTLFLSQSSGNPSIGIGTTTPLSTLDVRSVTSSSPANIVLRTNEDGVIEVGEETGRIEFAIESASFLGTNFISSGSTAAMFSRVVESSALGAIGNLVLTVNKSLATATTPVEAVTIGKGASASSNSEIGMAVSGNIDLVSSAPRLTVKNGSGNEIAHLGFHSPTDFNDGQLILFNQGAQSVKLNGDQSPADASFIKFGNLALGGTTAGERLTVEGNISASGATTASAFIGNGSALTNLPSQTDENFTTTLKNKLDGIEASADVTDTTNVTSAGALMDSEVTNLAQVKAFDSSDYATAAQGTKADDAATLVQLNASSSTLQTNINGKQDTLTFGKSSGNALKSEEALTTNDVLLMGSSNVKGRTFSEFRSDINVEDGADVTDTTNVTSAGALMDSELTDLAAVKAINQGLTTTSDVTFDDITATTIDVTSNKLAKTSATDADHQGDVVFFGSTISMDAGKIYHYNSGGTWELSNATDNTKSTGLLAVALGAASNTNGMLLKGMVTLDHDPGAVGDKLFLRTSNGLALNSAPGSAGNVTRVIGYCLDASNGQIYFNPSNDFIVHA